MVDSELAKDKSLAKRAEEILHKYHIAKACESLFENYWAFDSTEEVEFQWSYDLKGIKGADKGAEIRCRGHEIIVATSDFKMSACLDSDDFYADSYIYFDGELVLHGGAREIEDEWGSTLDFNFNDYAIKSFKAGEWLEMLNTCNLKLVAAKNEKDRKKKEAEKAEQDSKIDLGDYGE